MIFLTTKTLEARDNDADHDGDTDQHTEPDRIEPELYGSRIEDGRREHHECKVIYKGTAHLIDEAYDDHNQKPIERQARDPVCCKNR